MPSRFASSVFLPRGLENGAGAQAIRRTKLQPDFFVAANEMDWLAQTG
jgi:hypothetical protein